MDNANKRNMFELLKPYGMESTHIKIFIYIEIIIFLDSVDCGELILVLTGQAIK